MLERRFEFNGLGSEYAYYPEPGSEAVPSCVPIKHVREVNLREHIDGSLLKRYVKQIRDYSHVIFYANNRLQTIQHRGHSDAPALFREKSATVLRIIEHDVPSYAVLINILLSPIIRDIPMPDEIRDEYLYARDQRVSHLKDICKQTDIHHSLFYYNTLVAECDRGELTVYDHNRYEQCLTEHSYRHPTNEMYDSRVLTREMIDEVIENQIVPEERRDELMQWVGHSFDDLLVWRFKAYGDFKRSEAIEEDEIRSSSAQAISEAMQALLEKREGQKLTRHIRGFIFLPFYDDFRIPRVERIYEYLKGELTAEDLSITGHNAEKFLRTLKIIRLVVKFRNYVSFTKAKFVPGADITLRSMLLQLLPSKETHKVFLRTLREDRMNDALHWLDSKNWVSPRAAQRARVFLDMKVAAESLAAQLRFCMAVRGGSATGKTVWIRSEIGNAQGILTPDYAKAELKHTPSSSSAIALNQQVHWEGAGLFNQVFTEIKQHPTMPFVVDQRFLTAAKVLEDLVEPAEAKGFPAVLYDIESSSLTRLFLRMLTRPAFGREPCQSCEVITAGYKDAIGHRAEVIALISQRAIVQEYKLILDNEVVAEKNGTSWVVYNEAAYRYCVNLPEDVDGVIKQAKEQIITAKLVDEAVQQGFIFPEQKPLLERWVGTALGVAVDGQSGGKDGPAAPITGEHKSQDC